MVDVVQKINQKVALASTGVMQSRGWWGDPEKPINWLWTDHKGDGLHGMEQEGMSSKA